VASMLIATANARLTRSKTGVLKGALHTNGGTLVFNGRTHEQFVDLLQAIGSEVILTGSGEAFFWSQSLPTVSTSTCRATAPRG